MALTLTCYLGAAHAYQYRRRAGSEAPTIVLATILRGIVHAGVLQAGLPLHFVAVKEQVQTGEVLVVLIPAAGDGAIFVAVQPHAVVAVAAEVGIAQYQLGHFSEGVKGHQDQPPDVTLVIVAVAGGEVGLQSPVRLLPSAGKGNHMAKIPGIGVDVLVVVDIVQGHLGLLQAQA